MAGLSYMKVILQFVHSLQNTFISSVLDFPKMPFYAVARGRTVGIYMTWADCEAQVKGFSGARYKKFDTAQSAQDFITMEGGKAPASKANFLNQSKWNNSNAGTSNPNLKRSYSTSNNKGHSSKQSKGKSSFRRKTKTSQSDDDSDDLSDASDDLYTMINKQMDDIEKRTKEFSKGVDKIMKNMGKSTGRHTILIEPPQPKKQKSKDNTDFEVDSNGYVQVYTDGACSANGTSGARAGLGVYWGDGHRLNKSEPVSGRATNNCGEIQAATCAIKQALDNGIIKLTINTDSQFLINSVTKWIPGWKRKGWKLKSGEPVKNEIDFKELESLQHKLQVKWNYVEAHRGIHGNEMADQLAKAGAALYKN